MGHGNKHSGRGKRWVRAVPSRCACSLAFGRCSTDERVTSSTCRHALDGHALDGHALDGALEGAPEDAPEVTPEDGRSPARIHRARTLTAGGSDEKGSSDSAFRLIGQRARGLHKSYRRVLARCGIGWYVAGKQNRETKVWYS